MRVLVWTQRQLQVGKKYAKVKFKKNFSLPVLELADLGPLSKLKNEKVKKGDLLEWLLEWQQGHLLLKTNERTWQHVPQLGFSILFWNSCLDCYLKLIQNK